MILECILNREGGTTIDIDGDVYKFLPVNPRDPKSAQICEVANRKHIGQLLGISEGYQIFDEWESPYIGELAAPPVILKDALAPSVPDGLRLDDIGAQQISSVEDDPPAGEDKDDPFFSSEQVTLHEKAVAWLETLDQITMIDLFGKDTSFSLRIDKRMREGNMRALIAERIPDSDIVAMIR